MSLIVAHGTLGRALALSVSSTGYFKFSSSACLAGPSRRCFHSREFLSLANRRCWALLWVCLSRQVGTSWNKLEEVGRSWNKSCCLLNCIPRWWSASVAQAFRYFAIKNGEVVEVPFCYSDLLLRHFFFIISCFKKLQVELSPLLRWCFRISLPVQFSNRDRPLERLA